MPIQIPELEGTHRYRHIPFAFTEKLSASQVFLRLPDGFSPLERMVLQTTGNLQRLLSAYYNVPSRVEIVRNEPIPCGSSDEEEYTTDSDIADGVMRDGHADVKTHLDLRFERKIRMYFGDVMAYEADSVVAVKDARTLSLLSKHHYGLGQVFSHLKKTPQFNLVSVGRHGSAPGSSFWRDYTLTAPGVIDCYIREIFVEGLFEPCTDNTTRDGTVWYAV